MFNTEDYMNIFHEIKNSITLIGSSLQLIEKQHPEICNYDYWAESLTEIQYLRNLIAELSKNKIGQKITLVPMEIAPLMRDIVNSIRVFSTDSSFYCKLTIADDIPKFLGDALCLKQAILNLLKNSYEAMPSGGTVYLTVRTQNQDLCIDLIDSGCGIPADLEQNLFDSFITSKSNGTGLGLAITRKIIQAHHGFITCHNNTTCGCTFSIHLPLIQNE